MISSITVKAAGLVWRFDELDEAASEAEAVFILGWFFSMALSLCVLSNIARRGERRQGVEGGKQRGKVFS